MTQATRTLPLIAAGALLLASATSVFAQQGFTLDDFSVDRGQDLLDICTVGEDQPSYWEAQAFCYGYFQGGADFHQAQVSGPEVSPLVCPPADVTIRDAVTVFVDYARAHPEYQGEAPMDLVFRAVTEEWPCP